METISQLCSSSSLKTEYQFTLVWKCETCKCCFSFTKHLFFVFPINDVVVCAARKNSLSYDMVTKYTFLSHISASSSFSRPPELGSNLIKSVERIWFRRRTYDALNIFNYVRHMISCMSELCLSLIRSSSLTQSELCQTLICVFIIRIQTRIRPKSWRL